MPAARRIHQTQADQAARISTNEAQRRKECALARLREMEADEKAGELMRADQVEDAWTKILGTVKTGVLRLPDKLAPAMAAASDAKEARALLVTECKKLLQTLSEQIDYQAR